MEKLTCPIENPAFLLPHSGHMVLIDRVTEYGSDFARVEASVDGNHILLHNGALPATMGMEIMAQAIGAFAGIQALSAGEPVKLGFLLGTRRMNLFADSIPVGTKLSATATVSTQDAGGMGVFDCELRWIDAPENAKHTLPADGLLVQAALNVYAPKNAQAV
ncbi:hypothetical protein HMPREF9120_02889 [Neisseria sp. oral taxon 020 str. F0370]|uniref:ApeP family dehydratase n=1 Tax=unclassified Neisseria TaxID=2623750 RepID=UPI0002A4275C|nr:MULTISPECIES: hypothetical protein [unclassified Neisseria]ASP16686.1 thioester dehydrase [Neisseria sp. KEM232]EKY02453.1 hypothetical protein HMPREF9120_02889 [Neisseria sp. oral taxon 020 str. F0370]